VRFASKFEKFDKKTIFSKSKMISKNAEFHADFKSVEIFLTNCIKKSYNQNKLDEHE
jgi:hypothetical protein